MNPEERNNEILEAAMDAAREMDFRHLTREAVAERAGVTPPLVNYYMGNLEQIREAVVREAIDREDLEILAQVMLAKHKAARRLTGALRTRVVDALLLRGTA
jgi:AcrR family transcriptional regulator